MATKKKTPAPVVSPEPTDENDTISIAPPPPVVSPEPTDENDTISIAPPAPVVSPEPTDENDTISIAPPAPEVKLEVAESVLYSIFNDDPNGVYYSKDGETFLNEVQFEGVTDKSGYQKFEN
jgi:hypothetical protein